MRLKHLKVFNSFSQGVIAFGVLGFIFLLHVAFEFYMYRDFMATNSYHEGVVLSKYQKLNKNNKPYNVLKISTKNQTIYTTIWKKSLHVEQNSKIKFKISKKNIDFFDYLSNRYYAHIYALHVEKIKNSNLREKLKNIISNQHQNEQMKQLYSALYLATPIDKNLRVKIQHWGISHLVAISGFHLGVIYGFLFFVFRIVYGFFQSRYFPYRNANFDIGLVLFAILGFYMYLINFTPSFLRAFIMSLVGFIFYMRYFKILSFATLFICVAILVVFSPSLIFSVGFWFSVMGVFYIFLYLHHFSFRWFDTILINLWVFLAMIIPVHHWFSYASWQQFSSIILSILFVAFYPLTLLLHVIGYGGAFDNIMQKFLDISFIGANFSTPLWLLVLYVALSVISIFNRYLAIFTILLGGGSIFWVLF